MFNSVGKSLLFRLPALQLVATFALLVGTTEGQTINSSNPSGKGCFFNQMKYWDKMRVCNSDDPANAHLVGKCAFPGVDIHYPEIRIFVGNWESSIFVSWLIQIVLSELAGVPTTIETGDPKVPSNFYDPDGGPFQYAGYYDGSLDTFREALALGNDCRKANHVNSEGNYIPCFQVMPEVWEGENKEVMDLVFDGVVEPPDAIGYLGQETWFVTAFTAVADPTVLSYRTMMGEANRHKLAELFLRPTTWKDYCAEVSTNKCSAPDNVAQRSPTPDENNRMFVEGLYTGHFRKTEKNNCTLHPTNCTGHFSDFPNGWASYFVPITYHYNIALESDGPEPDSGGYSYETLMEIWMAANATKSNVMMMWSSPEWIYNEFLGTDAAFTVVDLPAPSQECLENRITIDDRQSLDWEVRRGSPLGACGNLPFFPLHKIMSTSLRQSIFDPGIQEGVRSPGLSVLDVFYISKIRLDEMYAKIAQPEFADAPREAICEWAVENYEFLQSFVPRTYPRVLETAKDGQALYYMTVAIGVVANLVVVATGVLVHLNRNRQSIILAQIQFLWILLAGALLVAIGAVLVAAEHTFASCVVQAWLIMLGYTLMLVPLIVKVWAINRLMIASRKLKRFQIKIPLLFVVVASVCVVVALYLVLWTAVDPPRPQAEYHLTDDINDDGETVVLVSYHCSSDAWYWSILGACWNGLLLLFATILAYQMRSVIKDTSHKNLSEAKTLAFLIYSHFWFTVFRLLASLMARSVDSWTLGKIQSLIVSVDTIVSVSIYFQPKLVGKDITRFSTLPSISYVDSGVFGLTAQAPSVIADRPPVSSENGQILVESQLTRTNNKSIEDQTNGDNDPADASIIEDDDVFVEHLKLKISVLEEEVAFLKGNCNRNYTSTNIPVDC